MAQAFAQDVVNVFNPNYKPRGSEEKELLSDYMAQAFAQDVVNVFNPNYKPRGSEEKELFTLQLYYVYAIFCSNLKTDFR
jgi:hypothetical protein